MPRSEDRLPSIRDYLHYSAEVLRATAEACAEDLAAAVDLLVHCYRKGGKVLLCGNGGSAAQCQHLAAELVNVLSIDRPRPPMAAIALTADTSLLTAIANDFGFEQIFERQIEALGDAGDVLLGISTSGNSPNLLRALEQGRRHGMKTLLLTGAGGGQGEVFADVAVRVPSSDPQRIQEAHAAIGHLICKRLEEEFPSPSGHR